MATQSTSTGIDHGQSSTKYFNVRQDNRPATGEIETFEPKTCYIGNGSDYWKASAAHLTNLVIWETTRNAAPIEISICYVSDLLENEETIQSFMYPEKIEEIHLDGIITQINFDRLVRPLSNLKLLEIHISSFEHFYFEQKIGLPFYLQLPNLENLSISSYNFTTANNTAERKIDRVIFNLCLLLRMSFPNLNFLAVSLPLIRHKENDITESILKCLKLHRRTLKSLNIESSFEMNFETVPQTEPLDFLRCDIELADLKDIQLHSFHFLSMHKAESTEIWRKFLQTQRKLEYLQFWCREKFFPLPRLLIHHNFRGLHTIALNIDPLMGTYRGANTHSIDCTAFHKCAMLKTLVLKGKPKEFSVLGEDSIEMSNSDEPHLSNFQLVPRGLTQIRLIHLNLTRKDVRIIVRGMHHLNKLYLEDIGQVNNLGMGIEDLIYLLGKKEKILTNIDILSGLNTKSIDELPKNSHTEGYVTIIKILFKSTKPDSFRAVLGTNGEYDILKENLDNDREDETIYEEEIFHESQVNISREDLQTPSSSSNYNEEEFEIESNMTSDFGSRLEEEDFSYKGLSTHNSVGPILLPRKSVSRYLKSRQKALKFPKHPTIHEHMSENIISRDEDIERRQENNNVVSFTQRGDKPLLSNKKIFSSFH